MIKNFVLLTREIIAIVLAGGKGSRLKELTQERAKPGLPFGGRYKIIDFTLSNCMNSGIRRIDILTQYKAHELISHVQKAWNRMPWEFGEYVNVVPAQQQIGNFWYQGTADAVFQNMRELKKQRCKYILILGGDHIYKMDFSKMLREHIKNRSDISIASIEVDILAGKSFGVLNIDKEMRIEAFEEKPQNPSEVPNNPGYCLASMGIYIFNFDLLEKLLEEDSKNPESVHDFGFNIIPNAIKEHKVTAYIFENATHPEDKPYWMDVGTIDQYYKANLDLVSVVPKLNLYDKSWPIYSFQEQLPSAKFNFDFPNCKGEAIDSIVAAGCIISGARIKYSVLFSAVKVEKQSDIYRSIILSHVIIGEKCKLRNVIIVDDCIVPDNTIIGYDLEMDKKYFRVTGSNVILVTQKMINKYQKEEFLVGV